MRDLLNLLEDAMPVENPAFAAWFNGSKAIDGDGQPMVCHHFTYNDFNVFDRMHAAVQFKRDPESIDRVGVWFTANPKASYAAASMGGKRMDCFLQIRKPIWLDDMEGKNGDAWSQLNQMVIDAGGATKFRANIKASGHDGIIMTGTKLDGHEQHVLIVLEPNQIKSVSNKGTFDPSSPDIYEDTPMDIRKSIELVEAGDSRVMVKGRDVYIDGTRVGEVGGGRFRHKGKITPDSGYYLRFPNNSRMYVTQPSEKYAQKGVFAYAKDLIQQIGWDADEILAQAAASQP